MTDGGTGFAELISKIAHELRSPLTSVKGFSATLVKRWDRFTDEQRLQFVETIHADAERMGRIVSEVLDLARLEANQLEIHPQQVAVHAIAEQSAGHLAGLAGGDRVTVDIPDDVLAFVDPERLGHMLRNLIENAIKFSDAGAIRVAGRSHGDQIEIAVVDEGIGIPDDRLDHLFSGPGPTGQRSGPSGTGLGLYLTRRLAEAHGGSLRVESRYEEGSTFTLSLPAGGGNDDRGG
ncbi:MAG TPA: HAMP domain-containing sensor histidine kinase [Actinomycetota bacterium]|nr:HAMP domain-containing sensor histidine kinase [Actinomycetota bacterium]